MAHQFETGMRVKGGREGTEDHDTGRVLSVDARDDGTWWTWHDADQSRWSADTAEAERRCAAWVSGDSDDGPDLRMTIGWDAGVQTTVSVSDELARRDGVRPCDRAVVL